MVDNLNAMFSHLRAENFKKFANHGEFECIFNHLRNGTLKLRISKAQPDFLYTFFCCNIHVSMYSNFSLFIENYCPRRCISSKVGVPKYNFFFSPHHRGGGSGRDANSRGSGERRLQKFLKTTNLRRKVCATLPHTHLQKVEGGCLPYAEKNCALLL